MSAYLSTPNMNDEAVATLKQLHRTVSELGHSLTWFIDSDNRVRLLVTVNTEWQESGYQIGDVTHTVSIPVGSRSADLDLSPVDVRILRMEGLLSLVEQRLDVSFYGETPAAPQDARRAA